MGEWGPVESVAALIAAFGGGAGFKILIQGIIQLFTGKQRKEKELVHRYQEDYENMRLERNQAQVKEELAYYRLRVMEDHAAECRRVIITMIGKEHVPDFPADGHPWFQSNSTIQPPRHKLTGFEDGL